MWTIIGLFLAVTITLVNGMCWPEHIQSQYCRADYVVRAKIISKVKFDIPDLPDIPTPVVQIPDNRGKGNVSVDNNVKKTNKDDSLGSIPSRKMAPEPRVRRSQVAPSGSDFPGNGYLMIPQYQDVTIKRVLKGVDHVKNTVGVTPLGKMTNKYPRYSGRVYIRNPGFRLIPGKWYLLSGKIIQNKLWVSYCDLHHDWKALNKDQHRHLKKDFIHGCKCRTQFCYGFGCADRNKNPDVCMWTGRPDSRYWPSTECTVRHSTCQAVNGRCQWKHSPSYEVCTRSKSNKLP